MLRSRPAEITYKVLAESIDRYGVTRLGSVTRLDTVGQATATAVRLDPIKGSISNCSGRGDTELDARVGALAEALERYCAEPRGRLPTILGRTSDLVGSFIPPAELIPARWFKPDGNLEWCAGKDLAGEKKWVPVNAVLFPYTPPASAGRIFRAHTHGLAVGSTWSEAVTFAILECIERDAYSRAVALATVGHGREIPVIAVDGAARFDDSIARILDAGLSIQLRDLSCDTSVPVVACTIGGGRFAHQGFCANPDPRLALHGAVCEAAQSRLVDIQGAREDFFEREDAVDEWFTTAGESPVIDLPSANDIPRTSEEALQWLSARLTAAKLPSPVVVDLSLDGVDMVAVRVVAPMLETWAYDQERIGERARSWLSRSAR